MGESRVRVARTGRQTYRDLKDEIWRPVRDTEYFISNKGRFRKGKYLRRICQDKQGYCYCNVGKTKTSVHRLVAEAFIPNPDNLPVVDHIDGNKSNNNVENLRWVTVQENTQAAYDIGLNKGSSVKTILAIDKDNNGYIYGSQVEAGDALGISPQLISKVVRGITNSTNNYKFIRLNSITDCRKSKSEN